MMATTSLIALTVLVFFGVLMLFFGMRAKEGRTPPLRPIPAFEKMETLAPAAIETGSQLHLGLGIGGVTDITTADTLAGISVLEHLSGQMASAKTSPIVTTADPVAALVAQNILRNAFKNDKETMAFSAPNIRWIAPQPVAYAIGAADVISQDKVSANVLVGKFGDEYLLLGEAGYRQKEAVTTVAGATDPKVLPFVQATSPEALWGEEMFAAGAYLSKKPMHIASLMAQDTIRWGVGLFILGGVLLKAFGVL